MAKAKKSSGAKGKGTDSPSPLDARLRSPASTANNIRNWRLFRKIEKQDDLARMTVAADPTGKGISRAGICRLESGDSRYNEDHIAIISRALGVSPRDLIGTNPFDAGDIFAVYAGLSDTDKRHAAKLVTKLKNRLTRGKSRVG